ncbi:MAG TPA: phosphoribosylglycinamide formyltransferase [Chthonomonadales bacterium]|nr:phosphoribosylglycinamide formyltransferase [Chthonomonadales bacterium]
MPLHIGVLVGAHGRGTNLQAIIEACAAPGGPGEVRLVVGSRASAPAMDRARAAGVAVAVVAPRAYADDDAYGGALVAVFREHEVDFLCLAGYMRLLPAIVVRKFWSRILNTHPALLPLFGGSGMYGERVHRAVLESGMKVSGCTVHIVDEEYDRGPIVAQEAVPVEEGDTPEALAARVLPVEHRTYVRALQLFAEDRVRVVGRRTVIVPPG